MKNVKKEYISKMTLDEKQLKSETIPNPVITGGLSEIGLHKISPIDIPKYLLMHPALPRGIEIKANRMVRLVDEDLNLNIIKNNKKTLVKEINNKNIDLLREEAKEYCKDILDNSGGPLFIKKYASGAYRFGTSFALLQTNNAENKVLRFEYQNEIFFGPAYYSDKLKGSNINWGDIPMLERNALLGKIKIDPKTKTISKYTQYNKQYPEREESNLKNNSTYVNTRTNPNLKSSSPGKLVPFGPEFDKSIVMQLAFDTIGDDTLGISLVQFLHLTIKYLLNMERGAAQTIVNFGFNKWKASTPFKDETKMRKFGQSLSKINTDAVVVLPENVTLENIVPGTTEFDRVHPIFMRLIAIRLGIPMPLLVQDGSSTNKSTVSEQRKEMHDDFIADELTVEKSINDGFFKSCQIKYSHLSVQELDLIVPKFKFKLPEDNIDSIQDRDLKFSLMIRNYSMSAKMWNEVEDSEVVKILSNKVKELIGLSMKNIEYSSNNANTKK